MSVESDGGPAGASVAFHVALGLFKLVSSDRNALSESSNSCLINSLPWSSGYSYLLYPDLDCNIYTLHRSKNTLSRMGAEEAPALPDYFLSPDAVLKDEATWRFGRRPDYTKNRKAWRESKNSPLFLPPPLPSLVHLLPITEQCAHQPRP